MNGPDFSSLLDVIDMTTLVMALLSLASLVCSVIVAWKSVLLILAQLRHDKEVKAAWAEWEKAGPSQRIRMCEQGRDPRYM